MFNIKIHTFKKWFQNHRFVFGISSVLITLICSFSFCFFGLDFTDSFFHVNSILGNNNYPLWFGTVGIIKFFNSIGCKSLIHYRIVNWTAYILAAIIPFFSLLPLHKIKSNLLVLAVAILTLNVLNFNVFGYDSLTILFLSINCIFFIKFFSRNSIKDLFFSSIFSAILVSIRFPNIIIIPIFIIILFISTFFLNRNNYTGIIIFFIKSFLYLSISTTSLFLLYFFCTNKLNLPIDILNFLTLNQNNSHTIKTLIISYVIGLKELFKYIGYITLVLILLESNYMKDSSKTLRFTLKFIIVLSLFILVKYELIVDPYGFNYSKFLTAISLFSLGYFLFSYCRINDKINLSVSILIIALCVVPIFGSNTGILKLAPFLVIFSSIYFIKSGIKLKAYTTLLIFLFTICSLYIKANNIYEDNPIKNLSKNINIPIINSIYTTPERATFIHDVMEKYVSIKLNHNNIIFWGTNSHIFHFITSTTTNYSNSFRMMPDDNNEIEKVKKSVIKYRPVIFFIPQYPIKLIDYNYKPFEEMLISIGYRQEKKMNYYIYFPK